MFGQSHLGNTGHQGQSNAASMPDTMEVCGCNGVCKGKITGAIKTKGLTTLDEVRAHTKASASCGTCTGLVQQVMALTLGDGFAIPAKQGMCKCTDLAHEDVRRLIKAHGPCELVAQKRSPYEALVSAVAVAWAQSTSMHFFLHAAVGFLTAYESSDR